MKLLLVDRDRLFEYEVPVDLSDFDLNKAHNRVVLAAEVAMAIKWMELRLDLAAEQQRLSEY